jgi:hypothetical protein
MDWDGTKENRCYRLGGAPFLHWIVVSTAVGSQLPTHHAAEALQVWTAKHAQYSTGTHASITQTNAQRVCVCVKDLTLGQDSATKETKVV